MKEKQEELLEYWLRISTAINNERMVSEMPYNEALICNLLYRNQRRQPEEPVTATDLCRMTRMLKSQMNRTLSSMEKKGLIQKERSAKDKRRVLLRLNLERAEVYQQQHEKILSIIDTLLEKAGKEQVEEIVRLFGWIADIAESEL